MLGRTRRLVGLIGLGADRAIHDTHGLVQLPRLRPALGRSTVLAWVPIGEDGGSSVLRDVGGLLGPDLRMLREQWMLHRHGRSEVAEVPQNPIRVHCELLL